MTETIERQPQGLVQGLTDRRTWTRAAYLLTTFPMGIFWFVALVTLISAGLPLIIIWIGLPILWFTFLLSRNGAQFERRLVEWGLGTRIETPFTSTNRDSKAK